MGWSTVCVWGSTVSVSRNNWDNWLFFLQRIEFIQHSRIERMMQSFFGRARFMDGHVCYLWVIFQAILKKLARSVKHKLVKTVHEAYPTHVKGKLPRRINI